MRERGINQGQVMRNKALSVAMKRKEEFLGARVPKELREKVMARATDQGIPVSILIRNILEEAFKRPPGFVSGAPSSSESLQGTPGAAPPATPRDVLASSDAGYREQPPAALTHPCVTQFPWVLGWEMIRLNRQVDCSSCGKQLLPGTSVTLGLVSGLVQAGTPHIILCDQCQGLM